MFSKPLLFGVLALACVAAAGGGAYLATRQAPASAAVSTLGAPPPEERVTGVAETEAIVADEPAPLPPAPKPALVARPAASQPAASAARRPRREPAAPAVTARRAPAPAPAPAPAEAPRNEGWSGLERTWPSRESEAPAAPDTEPAPALEPAPAEAAPPPAPARRLEELVVSADAVIGLQVETAVTSERARVEDRVEARLTRDVKVGNDVAIPAGARAIGSITLVERGGKVRERARLGIRFHTLVLDDGTEVPVRTETVFREGDSPARESAAKIGGAAVGGAILGAIFGGKKGAVLGGAAGAAGGTAATMAGDRNAATLPAGATLTIRLSEPATVTVEREQ